MNYVNDFFHIIHPAEKKIRVGKNQKKKKKNTIETIM